MGFKKWLQELKGKGSSSPTDKQNASGPKNEVPARQREVQSHPHLRGDPHIIQAVTRIPILLKITRSHPEIIKILSSDPDLINILEKQSALLNLLEHDSLLIQTMVSHPVIITFVKGNPLYPINLKTYLNQIRAGVDRLNYSRDRQHLLDGLVNKILNLVNPHPYLAMPLKMYATLYLIKKWPELMKSSGDFGSGSPSSCSSSPISGGR